MLKYSLHKIFGLATLREGRGIASQIHISFHYTSFDLIQKNVLVLWFECYLGFLLSKYFISNRHLFEQPVGQFLPKIN